MHKKDKTIAVSKAAPVSQQPNFILFIVRPYRTHLSANTTGCGRNANICTVEIFATVGSLCSKALYDF